LRSGIGRPHPRQGGNLAGSGRLRARRRQFHRGGRAVQHRGPLRRSRRDPRRPARARQWLQGVPRSLPGAGARVTASARARVWDLPTRLCHWGIALLIPLLWWSAEEGRLDIHIPAGLTMLGLVLFRLLWGLAGGSTARFAGFVRGPRAIL